MEIYDLNSIPFGNSGLYVNKRELFNSTRKWIEETPYNVKIKQIEQLATTAILFFGGILLALALTEKGRNNLN